MIFSVRQQKIASAAQFHFVYTYIMSSLSECYHSTMCVLTSSCHNNAEDVVNKYFLLLLFFTKAQDRNLRRQDEDRTQRDEIGE